MLESPPSPPAYGGFSEVARRLSDAGPRAVSRQGVYSWWKRRARNGFPDHHHLNDDGWKEWRIGEVISWYARYTAPPESHWGRRKEAKLNE
jgi:hypothetical protein